MPSVYLETTIASYLAAYPSRDLIVAAHQQITHEWWRDAPKRFDLYISEAVLDAIRSGDPDAVTRRLAIVDKLPILELNDDVRAGLRLRPETRACGPGAGRLAPFRFRCRLGDGLSGNMELCAHRQWRNRSPSARSERGIALLYAIDRHAGRDFGSARRSRSMNRDPIVDEVRQVRQKILQDCGGDLEKLLDRLKAAEAQDRTRVVSMKSSRQTFTTTVPS